MELNDNDNNNYFNTTADSWQEFLGQISNNNHQPNVEDCVLAEIQPQLSSKNPATLACDNIIERRSKSTRDEVHAE